MDPIAVGVLLLCVLFTSCSSAFGQGVSVSLRATWPSTPYIAEAAELLADDDPQLFWTFAELAMGASEPTEHVRCWAHITNLTTETMKDSPGVSQVAPLALASRQYSAKVEMLRQLHSQLHPGTQACCMVDLAGQTFTSATDLKRGLEAAASVNSTDGAGAQLFEFDHVMESGQPMQAGRSPPVAVLYAPLGSAACTAELHAELAAAARKGQLVYAWRPVLGAACQAPQVGPCASLGAEEAALLLPGWGVEAVLKNTEYSAMDDKDRKAAEAAAGAKAAAGKGGGDGGGEEGAAVEVLGEQAGFLFDTLVQRLPSARQELLTFRDHLLSSDEEEAVKVWDLKDMGLQATQRIMQAADPLALLAELSQNFPSLVSSLSRQKVNESLRAAVAHNQQFMSPGGNFMLINGLSFDINNFDLFGLLDRLRQELKVSSALSKLGLPPPEVTQLLQLRAEVSGEALSSARLDMGLGPGGRGQAHVLWLNDLQRDSQYTSRFSTHLTDLLHAFPGRLRPLALNLFNLVLVLDPTSGAGLATAELVAALHQDLYPIRFGLSLRVPALLARLEAARKPGAAPAPMLAWEEMTAAERFSRAGLTLEHAFGAHVLFKYWQAVLAEVQAEARWDEDVDQQLKPAFLTTWAESSQAASSKSGAKASSSVRARNAAKKKPEAAWKDVMQGSGSAAEVGLRLQDMASWQMSKGLATTEEVSAWLNGMQLTLSDPANMGSSQQELLYNMMVEQQRLQEAVYFNRLVEGRDLLTQILALGGGSLTRWNPGIIASASTAAAGKARSLAPLVAADPPLPSFTSPASEEPGPDGVETAAGSGPGQAVRAVTHVVVADLEDSLGKDLVLQAISFLHDGSKAADAARVVLLLNPSSWSPQQPGSAQGCTPGLLHLAVHAAFSLIAGPGGSATASGQPQQVASFLTRLLSDSKVQQAAHGDCLNQGLLGGVLDHAQQSGLPVPELQAAVTAAASPGPTAHQEAPTSGRAGAGGGGAGSWVRSSLTTHADLARQLGLAPGSSAVLSNGHLTLVSRGAADPGQGLVDGAGGDAASGPREVQRVVAEDFPLLGLVAATARPGAAVAQAVAGFHAAGRLPGLGSSDTLSEEQAARLDLLAAAATSLLAQAPPPEPAPGASSQGEASISKQLIAVMTRLKGSTIQVSRPSLSSPTLSAPGSGGTEEEEPGAATSTVPLNIQCILNPLTRPAQRLSQVLSFLRTSPLEPAISLILNPQRDLTDLPLKAFYRYSLPELAPRGAAFDQQPGPPQALFQRLPRKRVLTLNMDVPEPWLVEAVQSAHDLDNLRLADIPAGAVQAELELKALMLTGSCIDVTAGGNRGTPPRGLQLQLGSPGQPPLVDTLVMSNLAYFQLKAGPGRWELSLAPGRTQELYQLQGKDSAAVAGTALEAVGSQEGISTQVVVSSLKGRHMILRVRKRAGKEQEDVLLAAGEAKEGLHSSRQGSLAEGGHGEYDEYEYDDDGQVAARRKPDASALATSHKPGGSVINVFTVASGHMYERLQKIMILSVLNNTRSRVKFWFISNYMSPHHKRVIPLMAQHFGFEYGFVTYKWPHWLHKQTDKQRIIWAYKILFLDVLFPLSVERIIFVDSDQVVRTDLAELYHMDIKGAPYAYTPFCDNNKEMDEFRFWKGGFWRGHLQGLPYHISALYLVDLKRFRAMAAGDQLRVVYDSLSKDPNSLANLDQDLPNYAQHQIPIFSLPQQWLWCESWCGNATKAQAKTKDLCNNPKTKEPKLSAARRIIAEWPALDQQQEEFTASVDMLLAGDVESTGAHNGGEQCLERQGESACAPGVQQPADVHKQHEEL